MAIVKLKGFICIALCCLLLSAIKPTECKSAKSQLCLTRRWRICKHKVELPRLNDVRAILGLREAAMDYYHKDELVSSRTHEEGILNAQTQKLYNNVGEFISKVVMVRQHLILNKNINEPKISVFFDFQGVGGRMQFHKKYD